MTFVNSCNSDNLTLGSHGPLEPTRRRDHLSEDVALAVADGWWPKNAPNFAAVADKTLSPKRGSAAYLGIHRAQEHYGR